MDRITGKNGKKYDTNFFKRRLVQIGKGTAVKTGSEGVKIFTPSQERLNKTRAKIASKLIKSENPTTKALGKKLFVQNGTRHQQDVIKAEKTQVKKDIHAAPSAARQRSFTPGGTPRPNSVAA